MPSPRRRLDGVPTPARRPRVAGLRRPEAPEGRHETEQVEAPKEPRSGKADAEREPDSGQRATERSRPSPRRKTRDAGRAKPAAEEEVTTAEVDGDPLTSARPEGESSKRPPRRFGYAAVALLLVVGLVFSGLAVLFKFRHGEVASATDNTALVDVATTAQVKQAMSEAAESLFSVDFNDLNKTQRAADRLLVNDEVKRKYDALMGQVREIAPKQKMVVTVKATRSAVVQLDGDRAKVMVYIDQTATRTDNNQTSAGGAAMWLTTERRDGEWKVVNMDTYGGDQAAPSQQPAPSSQAGQPQGGN
ncbi:Mce-associated membrane protein [Saccharomonospora amisosensis]|uniref:Mce-associated membrane protein n=1 Tax=Saccharomonospora amisosensis TaxID=1128677 RepID=A0A7X5UU18_9PSEU|nr:nuclear transport factor 2 family protein [Saccharomonospora amisosensis]NIJ14236.1 Mce-associated membrane protein [Saccharomonospora amisosensis]